MILSQMGHAILALLSLAFTLVAAQTQPSSIESLPPCSAGRTPSTVGWQRVSYKRVELLLPPSLKPILVRVEGDHRDWEGAGLNVSLSVGYTGPHSYDSWPGHRCRIEIEGRPALGIEQVSKKEVSIGIWTAAITTPIPTPYHPFVAARSARHDDIPLLRAIVSSLKMAAP
jgi:hypothetical protein